MQMPQIEAFRDRESDYATLAHEMTHWTRHESRLNRDMGRKRFGDAGYAMEELVAEIGRLPLRRSMYRSRDQAGPCRLYSLMAQSRERRQAGDLHRSEPCAKGRRLSLRFAAGP